jgi:hypothetical protein
VAEPLSSGVDGVAARRIEPERKTTMTANDKIARRKLSPLELAPDLVNVSRACKLMGYSSFVLRAEVGCVLMLGERGKVDMAALRLRARSGNIQSTQ